MGVLAALTSACSADIGADEAGQEAIASSEDELYVLGSRIWRTTSIPVCWQSPATTFPTEKAWVRDAITNTWSGVTRARFTGWGTCASTSTGIRIKIEDSTGNPHVKALGRNLNGVQDGMVLNFTFNNWAPECKSTREACIRSVAVHEFGHALGFAHEQLRPDKPPTCTDGQSGGDIPGDTLAGPYDPDSIMNYCNPEWNNDGRLSSGDIKYSRQYYGNPTETTSRRDAVNWGNGKIYFFNKGEYTRYDIAADRADSGFPKPIIGNWTGWPSTWTGGIDAALNFGNGKVYFFRGAEYIRYDIATDRVDASPRALSGFAGFPSTWTGVDAAIRWNNGKVYFFRGSEYARFDVATNRFDQAPRPISGNWPGLFTSNIDYVFAKGTKAYFFRGTQYLRYDMNLDATDPGYPLGIVGYWPGVAF